MSISKQNFSSTKLNENIVFFNFFSFFLSFFFLFFCRTPDHPTKLHTAKKKIKILCWVWKGNKTNKTVYNYCKLNVYIGPDHFNWAQVYYNRHNDGKNGPHPTLKTWRFSPYLCVGVVPYFSRKRRRLRVLTWNEVIAGTWHKLRTLRISCSESLLISCAAGTPQLCSPKYPYTLFNNFLEF